MARPRREEPVLKKRENGIWYAVWYDAGLKRERRQSLETSEHSAAAIRFAEFLVKGPDDPRARPNVPGLSKPTVGQVLDWYEKDHVNAAEGPVAKERQRFAIAALKRHFANKLVGDVDIESSRAYRESRVRGLLGRAVSVSTVRRELGVLVAAANHALAWKRIKADEMPSVELPTEAGAHEKKPWLTKASIRLALEKAEGDLRDFILFAYYWGSRRQAVEQLRKEQVSLQHGTVDLHPPGARRTKKRKPIVPIYPEVRPALERRLMAAEDYLFPAKSHRAGGPHADFYEAFKTLCERHGITAVDGEGDIPWPHLLRHSRATHLLMAGESLYKVAKLLGDTTATVERVTGTTAPSSWQPPKAICMKSPDERRRYKTEWARRWYKKNPEKGRARSAKWVEANREQHNAKSRRYHAANREKALAGQARWREANKEYDNERSKTYHRRHPEVHRRAALKRRYGMTLEAWNEMFKAQGERCGCCGSEEPGGAHWHTDHEHTTGLVRGILCRHCNHMLTRFNNEDRLLKGVAYLRRHAPMTEALK